MVVYFFGNSEIDESEIDEGEREKEREERGTKNYSVNWNGKEKVSGTSNCLNHTPDVYFSLSFVSCVSWLYVSFIFTFLLRHK